MELSLNGEEGEEIIEGVALFKYLGRSLDQSDDDWSAVRRKIIKGHHVWGRLGVILSREGDKPTTSAAFYRAVVQVAILFGEEMCVLSDATEKRIVVFHTDFLQQVKGKQARRRRDGTWRQEGVDRFLKAEGTHAIWTYIKRRQAAVTQ